jgi:hypothetical protein
MSASNKYRQGQDHIAGFVAERIVRKDGQKIKRETLTAQFKCWFEATQGSKKAPKGVELFEYMDKKFGKGRKDGWLNVELLYDDGDEMDQLDDDST